VGRGVSPHFLRAAVNARRNTERFHPIQASRIRFSITKTTDAEPCLDELEVYTAGPNPTNVALASFGTKPTASSVFPNADIHRLEHINDGRYGNSFSWISNELGRGWVELELPQDFEIDRIVWSRDREPAQYKDRTAKEYVFEVSMDRVAWKFVAGSRPTIADCTFFALMETAYMSFDYELPPSCPRLRAWYGRFKTRPSALIV